jgi:phosphatidylglycerophosphate synthase
MEMKNVTNIARQFSYRDSLKKKGHSLIEKYIRVERYINRPLAWLVVRAVYHTPVTPNGLTYISFLLGLAAAALFSLGEPSYFLAAGMLVQLSSIVDCADGMLARSKNMCSQFGAHLDIFLDRIIDFFLIAGIAAGVYFHTQNLLLLVLGLLSAGLYMLQINLYYLTKHFQGNHATGETGELRALMLLLICILAVLNKLDLIIYGILAETALNIFVRVILFIRLGKKENN